MLMRVFIDQDKDFTVFVLLLVNEFVYQLETVIPNINIVVGRLNSMRHKLESDYKKECHFEVMLQNDIPFTVCKVTSKKLLNQLFIIHHLSLVMDRFSMDDIE